MISKLSTNVNSNSKYQINNTRNRNANSKSPSFNGVGDSLIKGVQFCEKNPMLNVAVIDLATAIIPRSIFESFTNIFAGFEAFRREASGLVVNCLIPGFLALGAAKLTNKFVMGDKADLSTCWAGKDGIDAISEHYTKAHETAAYAEGMAKYNDATKARVYSTHYNVLSSAKV